MSASSLLGRIGRKLGGNRLRQNAVWPPNATIRYGSFRRVTPVGSKFGADRGSPVDRFYIERFLAERSADIKGDTLEIANSEYTRRFGREKVKRSDVLHVSPGEPSATVIADLTDAPGIADNTYDCIILTQTLQFIFDVKAAVTTTHRVLRPGGVALVTVPGISQISRYDMDRWGDYWRFTDLAAHRLFADVFGDGNVETKAHGNVLAAITLLEGLPAESLSPEELSHNDPDYPLVTTVRAVKAI